MSQQINLFNPVFLQQKKYFSALTMVQAAAVIFVGMLLLYGFAYYQVVGMSGQAVETVKRLEAAQSRLTVATAQFPPRKKSQALEDEVATLEAQLKARKKLLEVLQSGELGNTSGFSGYLRAFSRQSMDGLWLTGFNIHGAGNRISIDGRALRPELVPAYIKRLDQEQVMQGKTFAAMEIGLPAVTAKPGEEAATAPRFVEFRLMSAEREGAK